jgi:predicted neutral ceramidase superfamily lipid hydrolase
MLVDIHIIALNFIVRTLAGAFLVNAYPSAWLLIIIFLLAIFWAAGMRKFELRHSKKNGSHYSPEFLDNLANISAAMLLIAYILYTSIAHQGMLMLTIPIATFMVFRYLYFIQTNNVIVQKSERLFLDKQMLIALVVWFILIVLLIYRE